MARVRVTLLIAVLLSLAGCSALLDFNAFKSLDTPPAPKASDYEGPGGLAKLSKDLSSAAVVDKLKADPTTTGQVETYLFTTYDIATFGDPLTATPDQQTAAALYADLYLATTSGDHLVNNAVTALISMPSGSDIKTLISEIIPADVIHDQAAFEAMVDGLLKAKVAYEHLGASLALPGVPPAGMNMGDVAQKAAVAYLMDAVVSAVETGSGGITQTAAADQMYLLANDQPNTITTNVITVPAEPLKPSGTPIQELSNIFAAAGMAYPG